MEEMLVILTFIQISKFFFFFKVNKTVFLKLKKNNKSECFTFPSGTLKMLKCDPDPIVTHNLSYCQC